MRGLLPSLLIVLSAAGSIAAADGFTTIKIHNPDASAKTAPVATFGMVFRRGDVPAGKALNITGADYQVDAKATHADGSLRHAVITVRIPALAASGTQTLSLSAGAAPAAGAAIDPADVLKTDFDAVVTLTVGGLAYSASARDVLAGAKTWLSGPLCTEWLAMAPLKSVAGLAHPHLHVRFAIRAYQGLKNIRADVTVENDWAYEPNPSGFTYDAAISVGGQAVYSKAGIAHTHHARWRKVFWWGGDPNLDQEYDKAYLFDSEAFPQYDRSIQVDPTALSALKGSFDPMANGNLSTFMPETGAQDDIGPLPHYAALYLLSQDPRARRCVLANGECGGSYQIHYRHKATDLPVSIDDFPYMTLLGNDPDTKNPKTGLLEAFPAVTNGLAPLQPDDAHQPSIGYLPYAISGDYFQLEELQFWADWNLVEANPGYRGYEKGLFTWGQNRAQAWSIRTLGQAAYITPDAHPLKKYFVDKVANNIAAYMDKYPKNAKANTLGYLEGHYPYSPFGMAPWMDDFFTWSMGYLVQLGFTDAKPMALWKSKFVVGRMTDSVYCWLQAGVYELQMGTADMVPYKSLAEIYRANYPAGTCSGLKMDGYPDQGTGYPANMQPALAMAVDVGAPGAKEAWAKYQTRSPKQDYTMQPQFSVTPDPNPVAAALRAPGRRSPGARAAYAWYLPGSSMAYVLPYAGQAFAELYDSSGRKVASIPLGWQAAGRHVFAPAKPAAAGPRLMAIKALAPSRSALWLGAEPVSTR